MIALSLDRPRIELSVSRSMVSFIAGRFDLVLELWEPRWWSVGRWMLATEASRSDGSRRYWFGPLCLHIELQGR